MARKTGCFRTGEITELRAVEALLAADSTTLTDANIDPDAAIDCSGLDTVLLGVTVTGAPTATITVEALLYDENAADGERWRRLLLGAAPGVTLGALANETTGALGVAANAISFAELRVFGHSKVFFRASAVANPAGSTAWKIIGMPGRIRGDRRMNLKASAIS